jgi:anaerobic selenocysteine-containing dehydrogenase
VAVSWRQSTKPQPEGTKFKVPPIDAPNLSGARDLGFPVNATAAGDPDLSAFRADVEAGRVSALYVFDPGPAGSIGDLGWVIEAKRSGKLGTLIYHGVLLNEIAEAADVVLPGASWVEKDASYVNGQGRLQGAARAIPLRGDAQEDWQIFVNLGLALGASLTYATSAEIRSDLAAAMSGHETYAGLTSLAFAKPMAARTWLQASNPSERWKWDFMFQDLPPVKFAGPPRATSAQHLRIPLQEVK